MQKCIIRYNVDTISSTPLKIGTRTTKKQKN